MTDATFTDAELVGAQVRLFGYARKSCSRLANANQIASDALQDMNIRALEGRQQFYGGSLTGWLFAILQNVLRDYGRKRTRRADVETLHADLCRWNPHDASRDGRPHVSEYEHAADHRDVHVAVQAAQIVEQVDAMPILTATALFCAGLGMNSAEIAEKLGTSAANVRQLIARGRQALRADHLDDDARPAKANTEVE